MNIGAYMYLIRGDEYKFPYQECIRSILPFCDGVHVLTDPRFKDTNAVVEKLELLSSKVNVHVEGLEFGNPGVDGISKARARELASQGGYDWLYQTDADECFRDQDIPKIEPLLSETDDDLICCGQINWFNGNHIKLDAPVAKERFSRNAKYITHGIPVQYRREREDGLFYVDEGSPADGAGYINMGGDSISGGNTTPTDKSKIFVTAKGEKVSVSNEFMKSLTEDIWIHHYSWYSIAHRWLREATWNYFWGILRGRYQNIEDYESADGKNIDFFALAKLRTPQSYFEPIANEMRSPQIIRVDWIRHPKIIDGWRHSVSPYIYGIKKQKLCKPKFSLDTIFKTRQVRFE